MAEGQEPAKPGCGTSCLVVVVLAVIGGVIFAIVGAFSGGSDDDSGADKYGAFDVCTTFVKRQLKSQSTAEFPNPAENDGEVSFSHVGKVWRVVSQVDAENSFGAKLTLPFTCRARYVGGDRWENLGTVVNEP